jgi:hypothetical protein
MVRIVFFKLEFNLEYYFKSSHTWSGGLLQTGIKLGVLFQESGHMVRSVSSIWDSTWNIILRVRTHGLERLLQVRIQLGILF